MSADEPAPFSRGRVWSFRGAPLATSRMIVGRVDAPAGGIDSPIVSVSLVDVVLPDRNGNLLTQTVDHVPVSADAIAESVIEPIGVEDMPPQFDQGYAIWREAFEKGEAGVYEMPLDRIAAAIGEMLTDARSRRQA